MKKLEIELQEFNFKARLFAIALFHSADVLINENRMGRVEAILAIESRQERHNAHLF